MPFLGVNKIMAVSPVFKANKATDKHRSTLPFTK